MRNDPIYIGLLMRQIYTVCFLFTMGDFMSANGSSADRWLSVRAAYWLIILFVLSACLALRQADPGFSARLRLLGFDMLQQAAPRARDEKYSVRIIDIDELSIQTHGSWPWRRDLLGDLVDKLFAAGVRVVTFDMVFPGRTEGALDDLPGDLRDSPELKPILDKLKAFGSPDDAFAKAIGAHPTVLGLIGTTQAAGPPPKAKVSVTMIGENVASFAPGFSGATGNLPALDKAAAGVGSLNWLPDQDQILRRIPLVVRIADRLYPSLVAESLRVYKGTKSLRARSAGDGGFTGNLGITTIGIGDVTIPTDRDGQLWLYFSRRDPMRSISATDVLQGKVAASELAGRIALIGSSAPGLLDLRATPLDPVISGVEINALALEQLINNELLIRPDYATGMEILLATASTLLLASLVYLFGARVAAVAGFASICIFAFGSLLAFSHGLLLDAAFPILTSSAAYIFGTGYLYYQAEGERNRGRDELNRIAREMEAAAQIQRTFLPNERLQGPFADRFDLHAVMKPAKAVGGDFYDYFLINDSRLGFAVGDVSGKGVPAALFMSVSRTVLRTLAFEQGEPGQVLSKVNAILARDNSEGMFVTIFYAILDLETGTLQFTSAGHDDALLLTGDENCESLHYMGPAIGLIEGASYPTEKRQLANGDILFLLTDGITEAFNIDGRVFGSARLAKSMTQRPYASAADVVQSIIGEVGRFADGTEQSDDITCVAVRFTCPSSHK